jgi:DNA-binding MarR family transcriptional regulator
MQAKYPVCWTPATDSDRVMLALSQVFREIRAMNRPPGLDFGTSAVLFTVAHHPEGIRISDVAESTRLDLSTASRHVHALTISGHLHRQSDPGDRRASLVSLTDRGGQTLHDLMQQRAQMFAGVTADWPVADTCTLADLLERLAAELPLATDSEGVPA